MTFSKRRMSIHFHHEFKIKYKLFPVVASDRNHGFNFLLLQYIYFGFWQRWQKPVSISLKNCHPGNDYIKPINCSQLASNHALVGNW